MIRLRSPTAELLAELRRQASATSPSYPGDGAFRPFEYEQTVGHGPESFEVGKDVLRRWQMHRDAGVRVEPVPLAVATDVVLWTRTLGFTLVFACRISEVFDDDRNFGFTYTTLPGHPEQGTETFRLELINDVIRLHIFGESRPALLLNKLSGPVGHRLQQQFTERYITSMRSAITDAIT